MDEKEEYILGEDVTEYADPLKDARGAEAEQVRIEALAEHLDALIGVVQWMSGSSDFAPEGQAGKAWPSAREKLFAAIDALAAFREEAPRR